MVEPINFEKATLIHQDAVLHWLDEPHVKEFWDNSQQHREDILNFMRGRKEPSPYHEGIFSYWIGYIENEPLALIMTSEIIDNPDLQESWRPHLSKTGKTHSIDFCIGNVKYFGKGLAEPTLRAFTKFFKKEIIKNADTFIIDPNVNNPKAKHVYEKAGFKPISKFERRGEMFHLMVKKL